MTILKVEYLAALNNSKANSSRVRTLTGGKEMKVGFIGLGNMGQPMARNLVRAGHELIVYNRTRSRAEELQKEGVQVADSPADVAYNVEALITMLADDRAVEEVIFGQSTSRGKKTPTVLESLRHDGVHISMSTISVRLSQRLAKAHAMAGQFYIAAPVFGRPEAASEARLWIVVAGPLDQIERYHPLFDAMGQGVFVVGEEQSAANIIKIAGNFVVASMIETLGEAFALVRKSGLEARRFLEIINALIKSPVYENYGRIIIEERYEPPGFKLKIGLKDMRLVLESADTTTTPMPLASLIHDHLLSAVARGQGEIDWSALARIAAENAGLGK